MTKIQVGLFKFVALLVRLLTGLVNGSRQMQFAFRMIWRELEEHSSANTTGIISKFKHTVKYPDLPSAMRPVPRSAEMFVPKLLIFSDDNSGFDEDRAQQERENFDSVSTFEASCS